MARRGNGSDGDGGAHDRGADVIPMRRPSRGTLTRRAPTSRAARLLERPDAERYLPTLPVQDVYYAIQEVGLADAAELVALASPEQLRGFLDLDAWERDRFEVDKARPWLEHLIDA